MVVSIDTEPSFTAGAPEVLFEGSFFFSGARRTYDITPDGQRFVMLRRGGAETTEDDAPPALASSRIGSRSTGGTEVEVERQPQRSTESPTRFRMPRYRDLFLAGSKPHSGENADPKNRHAAGRPPG